MTLQTTVRSLVDLKAYLDDLLQVTGLDEATNGLTVGGRPEIAKVGLAVNCSFQAIEQALARRCDLLITHHPARIETDAFLAATKYDRIREHGMNLYVAQECLDRRREFGTADALARAARVAIQGAFAPDGEHEFGVHGVATGRLSEFVVRVANQLGTQPRAWKNTDSFGHVGIIAGWGGCSQWMARALALGCDTLLTGEALMPALLFAREAKLNLVLAGHTASKIPGLMALSSRIVRDQGVEVTFIPEDLLEDQA